MDLTRNPTAMNVEVGDDIANSQKIPFLGFSGGHIHVPSGEDATLTFYVSDDEEGENFNVARDEAGDAVSVAVTGAEAIAIHPSLFGALWLKILASAISSGDSITYRVTLKS